MSFSVIHCAILPIMMVTVEGTRLIRYYLAVRNVMNIPCPSIKSFTVCQALNRVRSAVELDSFTNVEPYLKHSTSAIDTTSCFYQVGKISTRKKKVGGGGSGKGWTQLSLSFFLWLSNLLHGEQGRDKEWHNKKPNGLHDSTGPDVL